MDNWKHTKGCPQENGAAERCTCWDSLSRALGAQVPDDICPRWADGRHCFEVGTNRGSKHCTCGAYFKLKEL